MSKEVLGDVTVEDALEEQRKAFAAAVKASQAFGEDCNRVAKLAMTEGKTSAFEAAASAGVKAREAKEALQKAYLILGVRPV